MYLPTLVSPISMPSFSSSPWIRGAPQSGFSRLIFRINWRVSFATVGRPGRPRRIFHVQNSRKPLRCQPNDGFRPDDDQGRSPIAPDFAQPSPEEPIGGCQFRPLHRATQDAELVPKCQGFQLKGGSRFEGYRRGSGQHVKRAEHRAEELMKDAQTPCSHSIRCLRYPSGCGKPLTIRSGWNSEPDMAPPAAASAQWKRNPLSASGRGTGRHYGVTIPSPLGLY
jgi:hypothetical protein